MSSSGVSPSPPTRAGSPTPHELACVTCRKRKVRCDHMKPFCTSCLKNGRECIWPQGRKPSRRRHGLSYRDLAMRLTEMERLVQELQTNPSSVIGATLGQSEDTDVAQSIDERRSTTASSGRLKPFFSGAESEASIGSTGCCSMLSSEGSRKVDILVGDDSFTRAIRSLKKLKLGPHRRTRPSGTSYPLPPHDVIIDCIDDYMTTLNQGLRIFQEHEIRAATQAYFRGDLQDESGWYMAINIIIAHRMRKQNRMRNPEEYEKYLHNAMERVGSVILQTTTPLHVGALIAMVMYFVFTCENHIAVTLLSITVQFILLSGFHRSGIHPGLTAEESLHRRRLFWSAYVIDHDLMLRIGKPPLISDDFLIELPEEHPSDQFGIYNYPNNVSLNFFRQQVRLAQIEGHIFSSLYSRNSGVPPSQLEAQIDFLDQELQQWRESIPEMVRPEQAWGLPDANYDRLVGLTILHFTYYQLIVAIHSAAFRIEAIYESDELEGIIRPHVALCVSASRAAVSLLSYHEDANPFTMYLLYQVSWSIDIIFISILQNKTVPRASRDLQLVQRVVYFFEKYDPNHQMVFSYHVIKALTAIAFHALENTHMTGTTPYYQVEKFSAPFQSTTTVQEAVPQTSSGVDISLPMSSLSMAQPLPLPIVEEQSSTSTDYLTNQHQIFPDGLDLQILLDYQPKLWQNLEF